MSKPIQGSPQIAGDSGARLPIIGFRLAHRAINFADLLPQQYTGFPGEIQGIVLAATDAEIGVCFRRIVGPGDDGVLLTDVIGRAVVAVGPGPGRELATGHLTRRHGPHGHRIG
ncbi:MAG: hypothetical protein ACREVJ_04290, partial [Gammaproteobacteria bacterium]